MTQVAEHEVSTITLVRETEINAPPATVFDAVLAEMGPEGQTPDGTPFPMVLEPFPGGRWYRDLANGAGHWWGTVQVIKPPTLLEISGPLFMSYPAISHVQYRLIDLGGSRTRLRLTHRAMGQIDPDHRAGVATGWNHGLERIRQLAEKS